jgi:hypothetical protein
LRVARDGATWETSSAQKPLALPRPKLRNSQNTKFSLGEP